MKRIYGGLAIAAISAFWILAGVLRLSAPPSGEPRVEKNPAGSSRDHQAEETAIRQIAAASGVASSVPSRLPGASAEVDLLEFLRTNYPGDWIIQRDDSDRVTSIQGGEIPEAGKNPESAAKLARAVAPFLGVPAEQISVSDLKMDPGPRSVTFDFPQVVDGFEVFDGRLRLIARKEDGAVYMINTELHPVKALDPKIRFDSAEARRVLAEKYGERGMISLELGSPRPVVWAEGNSSELAWFFLVKLGGAAPDRLQVLVSARTSEVLFERSLVVH